jgi:hypothetical protein
MIAIPRSVVPSPSRENVKHGRAAGLDATRSVMSGVVGRLAVVRGASRRVAVQIADYGRALRAHADAIRSSYRRVAQNLLALEGAFAASRRDNPALQQAATAGVSLDPNPFLIVYGFDRDQRDGDWKKHARKLTNALHGGPERLVMVGVPRGYRLTKPRSGRWGLETLHQNDA